jgi:Flp pilus assembly protein TadG
MNPDNASFPSIAPQPRKNQSGQTLITVAVSLTMLLACAAFVVDLGYAYACYRRLQASADAAAVAAASALPNWTLAQQLASEYSATAGNKNVIPGITATMTLANACSSTLTTEFNLVCPSASSGPPQIVNANAVQVTEQANVPTFFAKILGVTTIPISVTASARARGDSPIPANVVVVAQATGHTGGVQDSSCPIYTDSSGGTWPSGQAPYQADCIKSGVRILLSTLWPCPAGQTCSSGNAVDEVSLMLFPGLNSTGADGGANAQAAEYTPCGKTTQTITPYIDENYASSSNPLFTVVPFTNNYRTSSTSTLNGGGSNLVQAVDWADGVGCNTTQYGYANIWETDYAPAITAAQAELVANSRPNTQNVIVLVSDGDAPGQGGCGAPNYCNGGGPDQCQQGVTAAAAAAHAGTWVYSIAYGSNTSGTCSTDGGLQACTAMQEMAISPATYPNPDPSKFYSDQGGQVGDCASSVNPTINSITKIFQSIGIELQTAALISNSSY